MDLVYAIFAFIGMNITVRQGHLSGGDGATIPAVQSQQFYAAKGSLHEKHMIGFVA